MGAAAIAAIIRRREQEVVDDFRAAGATSPAKALSYAALGLSDTFAVERLRNRAVIREAAPETYYLDEEVWTAVRRTRRRIATILLLLMALVLLGLLFGIVRT